MNKQGLIEKIRALMAKTVDAGCTEQEALAALDKARAMMDAYEITEAELNLSKEEKAILRAEPAGTKDAHKIKARMSLAIAEFCDCKVWRDRSGGLVFCGLPADAQLATWLLDSLTAFVQAELVKHLMGDVSPASDRRFVINGFCSGCCGRISERLRALVKQSEQVASSNSRALVVVKGQAVKAKMQELGIKLRTSSIRRRNDESAHRAGRAAGERATFGRPVSHGGPKLLGN